MNKNSFIAKFIYCYLRQFKGIKQAALDIRAAAGEELFPGLLNFLASFIAFLLWLLICVVPVTAIWSSFRIEYLTKEQIKDAGVSKQNGAYYLKKAAPKEEEKQCSGS